MLGPASACRLRSEEAEIVGAGTGNGQAPHDRDRDTGLENLTGRDGASQGSGR